VDSGPLLPVDLKIGLFDRLPPFDLNLQLPMVDFIERNLSTFDCLLAIKSATGKSRCDVSNEPEEKRREYRGVKIAESQSMREAGHLQTRDQARETRKYIPVIRNEGSFALQKVDCRLYLGRLSTKRGILGPSTACRVSSKSPPSTIDCFLIVDRRPREALTGLPPGNLSCMGSLM
jgi:hypothetical protein